MRITVIGGSGFIGTQLVKRLLSEGNEVVIVDKKLSKTYPEICSVCDIRDKESLVPLLRGSDAVYNLAAEHHDNVSPVSLYYDVNVEGSTNVLAAATKTNVPTVIFTSSVAVYGFCDHEGNEETEFFPFNDYGKSKAQAEPLHEKWAKDEPDRSVVIIRPTAVFGKENRGNIYYLFRQIASGSFLMVGNGKNKKSIAYVENLADSLIWSLTRGKGIHIYNYVDKPDLDMTSLVSIVRQNLGKKSRFNISIPYGVAICGGYLLDLIAKITGRAFPLSAIRVKKFCSQTVFCSQKIRDHGFEPRISLEEGLNKTIKADFLCEKDNQKTR